MDWPEVVIYCGNTQMRFAEKYWIETHKNHTKGTWTHSLKADLYFCCEKPVVMLQVESMAVDPQRWKGRVP